MSAITQRLAVVVLSMLGLAFVQPSLADDSEQLLRVDHYVRVRSTVPSIAGQTTQIYVREIARAATVLRDAALADRVVLFVPCLSGCHPRPLSIECDVRAAWRVT